MEEPLQSDRSRRALYMPQRIIKCEWAGTVDGRVGVY